MKARTPKQNRIHCEWCGKNNRTPSNWEQQGLLSLKWSRLCVRCANRRLDNPYNALLHMRRVTAETADPMPPAD